MIPAGSKLGPAPLGKPLGCPWHPPGCSGHEGRP